MALQYEPDMEAKAADSMLALDGLAELLENGFEQEISGVKIAAILRLIEAPIRNVLRRVADDSGVAANER